MCAFSIILRPISFLFGIKISMVTGGFTHGIKANAVLILAINIDAKSHKSNLDLDRGYAENLMLLERPIKPIGNVEASFIENHSQNIGSGTKQ